MKTKDLTPWTKTALGTVDDREDRERNFKRHLRFIGAFARPATDEQKGYYACISCGYHDGELYYTQFEGGLPAFMCLSCITSAYQRVKRFIEERAFAQ